MVPSSDPDAAAGRRGRIRIEPFAITAMHMIQPPELIARLVQNSCHCGDNMGVKDILDAYFQVAGRSYVEEIGKLRGEQGAESIQPVWSDEHGVWTNGDVYRDPAYRGATASDRGPNVEIPMD